MRSVIRFRAPSAVVAFVLFVTQGLGVFAPAMVQAQTIPGTTTTTYGYFSNDHTAGLTLVKIEADDPTMAGEMVSPKYADDFFEGSTIFTDYAFASDLDPMYIDQIDESDEYMVFMGNFDFYDGVKPGYVIMLSTSHTVFVMLGYKADVGNLFDLAEAVIAHGAPPAAVGGLKRITLDTYFEQGGIEHIDHLQGCGHGQ